MAGLLIDGKAVQFFPTVASSIVHFKRKPGPVRKGTNDLHVGSLATIGVRANMSARWRLDNDCIFVLFRWTRIRTSLTSTEQPPPRRLG